jgi:Na+/proline symporter
VLTAGVVILLPLSLSRAGGLGAILDNVPEGFLHLTSAEYGWSYIIPLIAMYALAWSSINWSLIQRYYCVPKERDAIKVGGLVIALYILGPPIMFFPAIAATQFLPGVKDAGQIYPILCTQLMPAGMLGLMVAAMFSATMSTLSSDYNVCASVLTNDVYRRQLRPRADQRELVFVGRMMTLLVGVIALAAALIMSRGKAEDLFKTMVTLFGLATAPVAVPMLAGLVSRRASNAGAIGGFACGIAVSIALYMLSRSPNQAWFLGLAWLPDTEEIAFGGAFRLKMETVMFLASTGATLGGVALFSALLPSSYEARERIAQFLDRLKAPIGTLPEDLEGGSGAAYSPFRVVGIATVCVGLLLLAVAPWVGGGQVLLLDIVVGALLVIAGGAMAWFSGAESKPVSRQE